MGENGDTQAEGSVNGADTEGGNILSARAARRRAAMIEAASIVFREHGFAEASLDMVIERSGGSRRTLYEHFGNKEGLFVASIEQMLESHNSKLEPLALGGTNVEEDLTRVGTAFLGAILSEESLAICRMVIAEMKRFPDLGQRFFDLGPMRAYAAFSGYLRHQQAAGTLDITDPDLTARQLLESLGGDLHMRAMLLNGPAPAQEDLERYVRNAVRIFLKGASSRPASPT